MTAVTTLPWTGPEAPDDTPRKIVANPPLVDRFFKYGATGIGASVLAITGSIGVFLAIQAIPTINRYGLKFFTTSDWEPDLDVVGIASVLLGTLTIALVAL